MDVEIKALKFTFWFLRITSMSCWRLEKSGDKWVSKCSKLSLLMNLSMMGLLSYIFMRMIKFQNQPTKYKNSSMVFPLFTESLIVVMILLLLCCNYYTGKFAMVINYFPPVTKRLSNSFDSTKFKRTFRMKQILMKSIFPSIVYTVCKFYVEYNMVLSYPKFLRFVHYFTFYCALSFTIHVCVCMDYVRGNYLYLNYLSWEIENEANIEEWAKDEKDPVKENPWLISAVKELKKLAFRKKVRIWLMSFMELRQLEDMINEIFGKQIFLTLLLSFSAIIINTYFWATLNLYKTSNIWLNLCFIYGFFEAVIILYVIIRAVETTCREANKINVEIFNFPISLDNWYFYKQARYFQMFLYNYPMQFRAWVFHTISYSSFFKVMAASLTISIVFLQCEFMRSKTSF